MIGNIKCLLLKSKPTIYSYFNNLSKDEYSDQNLNEKILDLVNKKEIEICNDLKNVGITATINNNHSIPIHHKISHFVGFSSYIPSIFNISYLKYDLVKYITENDCYKVRLYLDIQLQNNLTNNIVNGYNGFLYTVNIFKHD